MPAVRLILLAAATCACLSRSNTQHDSCLDNSLLGLDDLLLVTAADRRNITVNGRSLPLGLWIMNWDSTKFPTYVMQIIAEEVLGYYTTIGPGGGTSISGVYSVAGCDEGTNCLQELLDGSREIGQKWHFSFEVWQWAEVAITEWESQLPRHAPMKGAIGYKTLDGHYVNVERASTALAAEGLALDTFRAYDASRWQARQYFDNISTVSNTACSTTCSWGSPTCPCFTQCSDMGQVILKNYNDYFPNDTSVFFNGTGDSGEYVIECMNGIWWLSPACREDPSQCIPYIDMRGWGSDQMLQMASHYNLPFAIALAGSWGSWMDLVRSNRLLTYWYEPDGTFTSDGLTRVLFPAYNEAEHARGLKISTFDSNRVSKLARPGIQETDLNHVFSEFSIKIEDQNLYFDLIASGRPPREGWTAQKEAACSWMRQYPAKWTAWLPDPTKCVAGEGLVDGSGNFVDVGSADDAKGCDWCPPGYHSRLGQSGTLRFCLVCPQGEFQKSPAQEDCERCAPGRFTSQQGRTACEDCPIGQFEDGEGSSNCSACPKAHETTEFRGTQTMWGCVCEEDYYRAQGHSEEAGRYATCERCPAGMSCAEGNGEPLLLEGYWAAKEDDVDRAYSVYRCRNGLQCPGGSAGSCAQGREGRGCAFCQKKHQKGDDGVCTPCAGASPVPIILAVVFALAVLAAIGVLASRDVTKVKSNTIAIGICMGQAVVFVQSFQLLSTLKVVWSEPYVSIMNIMAVISLDLDMLNISCFLNDSSVVSKYIIKLLTFPFGVLCLVFIMLLRSKVAKSKLSASQVVNSIGLLTLMLFLVLNMHGMAAFHCISSPNGTSSLESSPAVTCYEGDWYILASFGALAIAVYGVLFPSWTVWVTLKFPLMVTSPEGMMVVSRYAFLFQRFTVECYYFTPVYLARALAISLLPVVFANYGHRQIISLSVAFVIFGSLIGWLKPLRGILTNSLEVVVTGSLMMSLVCAGLLLNVDGDILAGDLQVFFIIIVMVILASFLGIAGLLGWRLLRPGEAYVAFLCHHKVGCGIGARLMKMELEQKLKAPVFLDSDNLEDLDSLLDTVRCNVQNLIILLTTETLSRPWCAGEIATAFTNKARMIPVAFDNYEEPSEHELEVESIRTRWSAQEFAVCQRNGVSIEILREALVYLKGLPKETCNRVESCIMDDPQASVRVMDRVAAMCRGEGGKFSEVPTSGEAGHKGHDGGSESHRTSSSESRMRRMSSSDFEVEVAVLASNMDAEAISAAFVLARMIRQQTHGHTIELLHPNDVRAAVNTNLRPNSILVLLSEGALISEGFSNALFLIEESWGDDVTMLPVGLERFSFPSGRALEESIVPQVSRMHNMDTKKVASILKKLFTTIAVKFSGTASMATLRAEVTAMVSRAQRQRELLNSPRRARPKPGGAHGGSSTKARTLRSQQETFDDGVQEHEVLTAEAATA